MVRWHYNSLHPSNTISSIYFVRTCHPFLVCTIYSLPRHQNQGRKDNKVDKVRNWFRNRLHNCWNPGYRIIYSPRIWKLYKIKSRNFFADFSIGTYPNSSIAMGTTAPIRSNSSTTFDHILPNNNGDLVDDLLSSKVYGLWVVRVGPVDTISEYVRMHTSRGPEMWRDCCCCSPTGFFLDL